VDGLEHQMDQELCKLYRKFFYNFYKETAVQVFFLLYFFTISSLSSFLKFTEIARVFAAHVLLLEVYQFTVAIVLAPLATRGSRGIRLEQRIACDTMTTGGTVAT
jgi:hypothetical protein